MYSSIEEENRQEVINKCYWPLFKLADFGIPIGIEAPAVTLEIIKELDPNWIEAFSTYLAEDKIEFIGSGYSQIIGPLVPAKVNKWNQQLGLEYYRKLLGANPQIALINEMAYSGAIVEHCKEAGYKGIIMEWNNPRVAHQEWNNEWRYFPQKAIGNDGQTIPLIWSDSIAFQKYQRYAHGEVELEKYIEYIKSHIGDNDRYFPLYSNDVEIFDYRPGRYNTEAQIDGSSEWGRIIDLYSYLNQQDWSKLIFSSDVLDGGKDLNGGQKLQLESAANPIPVKKQEKYNINRWALSGRDDLGINTKCYQIYDSFIQEENDNSDDWKELCYLWSSDFRTHITKKRWGEYISRLDNFNEKWQRLPEKNKNSRSVEESFPKIIQEEKWLSIENGQYKVKLNKNKGLTIQELICKDLYDDVPIVSTLDHGYYDDISFGADYYSGHAVIERPGEHKVTDLGKLTPEIVETDHSITLKTEQEWANYKFTNMFQINSKNIIIKKIIESDAKEKAIVHPYNFTFNPQAWDRDSLYIETHNGGSQQERFYLKGQNFSHGDIYSSLISARHGFGNTDGLFVIGDKYKSIHFECEMIVAALIPSIIYKEMNGTFFFRLQYSAREMDETLLKKRLKLHTELIIHVEELYAMKILDNNA
jgi:hypothetical protein